jgi:Leucine-rich repeat (LRR) protein
MILNFILVNNAFGKCKIDNEYCSCHLNRNRTIIKLDCIEKTNTDILKNVSQTKEHYDFSQMIVFTVQNKLIKNISNSNLRHLLSPNLKTLSISDCKIQSIEKGMFNSMLQLTNLSLSRNEIESIEADSFLTEPFESNILELLLSENKLTKIQQRTFSGLFKLQILHLDKNVIEEIDKYSFYNLNNLRELKIETNKIKIIRNEMFFGKTVLEILYLYQNSIETIESIPFNTLRSLKKLHLFSNKIKQIKFGHFIHLQNLDELRLDKNEIGTFDANTFIGLDSLKTLDLSANKIKILKNEAFHTLLKVTKLDLHLNDINQIETKTFIDLNSLNYLNLDSNQVATLENVQFNSNLKKLTIRFNLITNLNEINSSSLEYLDFSNNRIQEINFTKIVLPNLEYLDLSHNLLSLIKDDSLNNLKHLNLSYNKLDLESEFNNISYFKGLWLLETLDISFNEIEYLDSNQTFQYLNALKYLNLSNNKLKTLDAFIFGYLSQLTDLNLASNNLRFIDESYFSNLVNLKKLKLSYNQVNSTFLSKTNTSFITVTSLDLDYNKIDAISENDFELISKLKYLNLNSNPIKTIHEKALAKLIDLETLKLSNTSINNSILLNSNLKELDLSYLNVSILNIEQLTNIEWINLANSQVNFSFGLFLSNSIKFVDFSYNQFKWENDSKMFNLLGSALEVLKLRQTNLQKLDQINLKNLINLKYLDLSFNNLNFISQDSFEFNLNLEYLDLSSNSLYEFSIVLNKLKYLNLENNQINFTSEILKDYYSIEIFKIGKNRLRMYPSFEMSQIKSENVETFLEIHLNQNQINEIKYFSFIFGKLLLANFDSNQISSIETDAFLNCRSLQSLSIAQNRLSNLTENNFHFLFSLIHLNLSFNEINFIEQKTFSNLNKLKSLDLNYNKLISIENDLFYGLTNLNDLYLLGQNEVTFYNKSFHHLPNISSIVLNESLISNYKCLFMHNLQRDIQRTIYKKYIFYKSINLLTLDFSFKESYGSKCDLMFHLFQFKIHFNLKTDYDNDLFYDSCQKTLIKRNNSFNHNKRECLANFEFNDKEEEETQTEPLDPVLKVMSNFFYILSMALFLSLLAPGFYIIMRYEIFSNFFSKFSKSESSHLEKNIKMLEKNIKINRDKIGELESKLTREKKKLNEKIEKDTSKMEKNYKELQSYKSQNKIQSNVFDLNSQEMIF